MMALQVKIGLAISLPAALAGACIVLATIDTGSDAPRLWRISIGWAAIGVLTCLVVWALDRAARANARAVSAEQAIAGILDEAARACREAHRARKLKGRLAEVDRRLEAVENDALGRQLAKQLWDDDEFRKMFGSEGLDGQAGQTSN
jgi:hypothetical protein